MTALLQPDFPPLLKGMAVGDGDPFVVAVDVARGGEVEPGLIHYSEVGDALRAAVTLAPEEPLERAIGAVFAVQLGLVDALGALAPPEVAVHFVWPDAMKVNGAQCGRFRAAASTRDPAAEPDWLVVGYDLPLRPKEDEEPGLNPYATTLFAEGCGEISAPDLLEAWSRHMLMWIHTYLSDGLAPLHEAWSGKCDTLGGDVTVPQAGTFVGLDELGGMVLRRDGATTLLPLTTILEA